MADLTRCWCSLIHKGAVQAKTPGKHSMWRERVKSAILTLIAPIAGQVRPRAPANYTPHAPTNYTLQLNLHSARSRCVFFVLPCACEPIVGDQATARPGHSNGTPGPQLRHARALWPGQEVTPSIAKRVKFADGICWRKSQCHGAKTHHAAC